MSATLPHAVTHQKILVVDDNPASLYATVRIIRAAGFEVVEAVNGTEALAKADHTIGLIVLDTYGASDRRRAGGCAIRVARVAGGAGTVGVARDNH